LPSCLAFAHEAALDVGARPPAGRFETAYRPDQMKASTPAAIPAVGIRPEHGQPVTNTSTMTRSRPSVVHATRPRLRLPVAVAQRASNTSHSPWRPGSASGRASCSSAKCSGWWVTSLELV